MPQPPEIDLLGILKRGALLSADEGDGRGAIAVVERDDNETVRGERGAKSGISVFGAAEAVGEDGDGPAV